MSDLLGVFEKCAKGVRGGLLTAADVVTNGIVAASDQLALALDGLCRAPEEQQYAEFCYGTVPLWPGTPVCFEHATANCKKPHQDSAVSPPADAAPVPKPGDSSPSDSAILTAPEGHLFHVEASLGYRGICEACGSQVTALLPSELAVWRCIADKGGRCKSCEKSEK